jgi:hypothetical protein
MGTTDTTAVNAKVSECQFFGGIAAKPPIEASCRVR